MREMPLPVASLVGHKRLALYDTYFVLERTFMFRLYKTIFILFYLWLFFIQPAYAEDGLSLRLKIPYSLQSGGDATEAGTGIKALLTAENTNAESRVVSVRLELPPGFTPLQVPAGWRADAYTLEGSVKLGGGYSQWFELFSFNSQGVAAGDYSCTLTYSTEKETRQIRIPFSLGPAISVSGRALAFKQVTFPVDRYGKIDQRLNQNTLVLRDKALDYLKSIVKGKGAYNAAAESVHPLTYVRLEFANPGREEKLLLVTFSLLDSYGAVVPGLTTPSSTVDDKEAGDFSVHQDKTIALIALNGSAEQIVDLPIYTADEMDREGKFTLQIMAREGGNSPLVYHTPVKLVARNSKAAFIVLMGVLIAVAGVFILCHRWRRLLACMKTRWLITIALFGSTSFAVVNVPATLLSDVLHLLLGPMSFLITGMFNGVILYMLIAALVILIPIPGTVALLFAVRMLLNMLIFGHASPTLFLFYAIQAALLEFCLYFARMKTSSRNDIEAGRLRLPSLLLLPIACAVADGVSTFIHLHTLAFLYRLFYADWYIGANVLINGFLYTSVGAGCGIILGNQLKRVGCD